MTGKNVLSAKKNAAPLQQNSISFFAPFAPLRLIFPELYFMDRLAALTEMLKENPHDAFLQYGIALEYAAKGDVPEAIARIEKLLSEQPDYLGAYYQLAQYYEIEDNSEEAADTYRRGIILAEKQGNKKTLGELRQALDLLD